MAAAGYTKLEFHVRHSIRLVLYGVEWIAGTRKGDDIFQKEGPVGLTSTSNAGYNVAKASSYRASR